MKAYTQHNPNESIMLESKPLQRTGSNPSVRKLKIEADGDFWKGLSKPKIRLMGHWLARAGFSPGGHVHVVCVGPGVIELRSPAALTANETKPVSSVQLQRSL